jgi:hypothetical protein
MKARSQVLVWDAFSYLDQIIVGTLGKRKSARRECDYSFQIKEKILHTSA